MKLRNKIFNYFVVPPLQERGMPEVILSPVTMNSEVAKTLIARQFKDEKMAKMLRGKILHVCFDYDSEMIYIPNASHFSKDTVDYLLKAAEVRITKDFGGFSSRPPIEGSPFSSLRVRSLNSFSHAKEIIGKHYQGKIFKDLPVIEVYLPRMPSTLKQLPPEYEENEHLLGGYISPSFAKSITFVDEIETDGRKRSRPIVLLDQVTPFILINIAQTKRRKEPTATEKEWVVLSSYRDYLQDIETAKKEKYMTEDISKFAHLYAIKRYLYLGWSLEEVSWFMNRSVSNFPALIKAIDRFMQAADALKNEGHKDPASNPYYISFKVDKSFPIDIQSFVNPQTGRIDIEHQYRYFVILEYDPKNSYILIETPVFISPEICIKVLKAQSIPFIAKYNPVVNKIDVKGDDRSYQQLKQDKRQLSKIKSIVQSGLETDKVKDLDYRTGPLAAGRSYEDPKIYNVRRVSDYLYAADFIKKMCKTHNVPFHDFDVVVGPIADVLGAGTMGGFMDEKSFDKSKIKPPFQLSKGVWISPPVMLINSVEIPSYAEQTETLIHEYRHYIYHIQYPDYEQKYGRPKKGKDTDYEYWWKYLTDPNELAAHKEEIKFELGLGKSYDEIIRNKVGGQITKQNYPIAIKFSELVQEVVKELEEEKNKNEEPIG